ncbi:hypothetical protein OE749_09900 [Aestuariibacter sp. AA17]|uniref:Chemotaxis methyl-accepting receptor HlyB-like 4HB MCP domain-containing protein n=1 Tax=Fluctibacter corallii TaxID=2984329 RepID=A0ABT3A8U6_9ALTE|nr:hypothetical protein [Aestuariibacter sp. AA17]MCV2885009.1 hypothetical protein [Aestuariibacter sp. AA17]
MNQITSAKASRTLVAFLSSLILSILLVISQEYHGQLLSNKYKAQLLARDLKSSSDMLTQLARLHVATGQGQYFDYFQMLSDARAGAEPLPKNINVYFWDQVIAGQVEYQASDIHFALKDELAMLALPNDIENKFEYALNLSDTLIGKELDAMYRLNNQTPSHTVDTTDSQHHIMTSLMDQSYLSAKANIMYMLQQFTELSNQYFERKLDNLASVRLIVIIIFIGSILWFAAESLALFVHY